MVQANQWNHSLRNAISGLQSIIHWIVLPNDTNQ